MVASIKSESDEVIATAAKVEMTLIEGLSEDRLHTLASDTKTNA